MATGPAVDAAGMSKIRCLRRVAGTVDEAAGAPLPRKGMIPRAENRKMIPHPVGGRKGATRRRGIGQGAGRKTKSCAGTDTPSGEAAAFVWFT